jgi:ketosteroid isomerase-like protein
MKTRSLPLLLLAALLGLAAGSASAADLTASQQAAIRQEVIGTIQGMLAAEERLDADAVWSYHAEVPGYWWADIDGKFYDFAGTKKSWADYYTTCAKLKFTTRREEVMVLGPDTAFYLWHGAAEITGKDGAVTRVDPWTARYLCRRIGGVWKIVGGQESSVAPQPVPSVQAKAHEDATAAVKQLAAELDRLSRAADLDGFMRQVADDVVSLPPDQPAVEGATAVREWYKGLWATVAIEMKHNVADVHAVGDLIVARGTATGTVTPRAGGPPFSFDNKFLFVLKRTPDGALKIWRVAFNTNAPAKAPVNATTVKPEEQVAQADRAWAEACAAKSVDQMLSFYAPDAVFAQDARPAIRGSVALQEFWTRIFADPTYHLKWRAARVEVLACGDLAYSTGLWEDTHTEAGAVKSRSGTYFAIWQKQPDGNWRVLIDRP